MTIAPDLTPAQLEEAARSCVEDRSATETRRRARLDAAREAFAYYRGTDRLRELWLQQGGFPRSVAQLSLLFSEVGTAEGVYYDLLVLGLGKDPVGAAVEGREALMSCKGDLSKPAHILADLFQKLLDNYAANNGVNQDYVERLRLRVHALRRGPLPEGGYGPL